MAFPAQMDQAQAVALAERLMEIFSKSPLNQLASGVSTSPQLLYEWR
jgi:hypothetical protein